MIEPEALIIFLQDVCTPLEFRMSWDLVQKLLFLIQRYIAQCHVEVLLGHDRQ